MGRKEPYSGQSDEALTVPGTDVREAISGADFDGDGVVFWLRWIQIANEHASQVATAEVYDQDEGAATAANQRLTIICPANTTTLVELPAPGMKFTTNVTVGVTNGTVNAYGVAAGGYRE